VDHRRRPAVRVPRRRARPRPVDSSLLDRALTTFERNFLIRALERSGWNVTQTARYLGVPLSTLKFKMDRLEIRELAKKIKGK
jgi:DNA-binding NtrC family response regulator